MFRPNQHVAERHQLRPGRFDYRYQRHMLRQLLQSRAPTLNDQPDVKGAPATLDGAATGTA